MSVLRLKTLSVAQWVFHFAKGIIVFAVLGPLVGWATLLVTIYVMSGDFSSVGGVPQAFILGAAFSYIFGLVPAVLTGLIVGLGQIFFRSFGFFHALAIGIAVGLLLVWKPSLLPLIWDSLPGARPGTSSNSMPFTQNPGNARELATAAAILVSISVVPTLVCWFLSQAWQPEVEETAIP